MLSGISTICFAASYAIAFALELVGLKLRFAWHRAAIVLVTLAGLAAHTLYLGQVASHTESRRRQYALADAARAAESPRNSPSSSASM